MKEEHITTRINKTRFLKIVADINVLVMNLIKFPTTKEHRKDLADIYAHFATNLIEVILKDECTKEEMNKHMKKAMIRIGYNEKMVDEMLTEIEMEVVKDLLKEEKNYA